MESDATITEDLNQQEPGIGDLVGLYRLQALLGKGATGTVYRAVRDGTPFAFAVKLVDLRGRSRSFLDRLLRECQLTIQVRHPHIITVHEAFECGPFLAIVMDIANGKPADHYRDGVLGWEIACSIALGVAEGLRYAWDHHRIIHRDIKPANIVIDIQGGLLRRVQVVDFGLARVADEQQGSGLTMEGAVLGTPYYLSPEQARGEITLDFRTDVYALGATLFSLIAGRPPFATGKPMEILVAHCSQEPPSLRFVRPSCPVAVAELVARCLRKNPASRCTSWAEILHELHHLLGGDPFERSAGATALDPGTLTRPTSAYTHRALAQPVAGGPPGTGSQRANSTTNATSHDTRSSFTNSGSRTSATNATNASSDSGDKPTWKRPVSGQPPPVAPGKPITATFGALPAAELISTDDTSSSALGDLFNAKIRESTKIFRTREADPAQQIQVQRQRPLPNYVPPHHRPPTLHPGTLIDSAYRVVGPLGAGAMGEVYAVRDTFAHRDLALKILSLDDMQRSGAVRRFHGECSALATVDHPAFPFFAGKGGYQGRDYVLMERVDGIDLKEWLHRHKSMGEDQALDTTRQLSEALNRAYTKCGMVHRDLKPANLMFGSDDPTRLRIIDFGVSTYIDFGDFEDFSTRTYTYIDDDSQGRAVGTPAYMSPEQCLAEPPTPLMDIYAVGCVLFTLLTGDTPYRAPNAGMMMMRHLQDPPPEPPATLSLSSGTQYVLKRCLAKKPAERFRNYKQLIAALSSATFTRTAKIKRDTGTARNAP